MAPQERQFVPIASLEHDLASNYMKEATASKAQRIAPLKNGPLSFFEDVFHDTNHVGRSECGVKHLSDGRSTLYGRFGDLVVHGVFRIESCELLNVRTVEGVDPSSNKLTWLHAL